MTRKSLLIPFLAAIALATSQLTWAQTKPGHSLQSDEIKAEVGQEEKSLGVKIQAVEQDKDGVKISVSVPKSIADGSQGNLEEVVVYGKKVNTTDPRPELKQLKRYEVVNNLEQGRSGLVIYLGKNEDFMLRLNYTDDQNTVHKELMED